MSTIINENINTEEENKLQDTYLNQVFSSDEVKEFFESIDVLFPLLPINQNFYQVDTYLFSNNANGFYLPDNFTLDELKQDNNLLRPEDPEIYIGFTGFGFNSWNFVYKYSSNRLELNIYTPLQSVIFAEEGQEQKDEFLALCFKVIELCLFLENNPAFFQEGSHDKLIVSLTNEKTEFLSIDKDNLPCAEGTSLDELFQLIERKLEVLEQQESSQGPWVKI